MGISVQSGGAVHYQDLHQTMRYVAENDVRPEIDVPFKSIKKLIGKCWAARASTRPKFNHILKILEVSER